MTSILDIVPADASKEKVKIRGTEIDVYGISLLDCVKLLKRYPDLASIMMGQGDQIAPERMVTLVPEAAVAIIAAGLGACGDEAHEAAAGRLGVEEQIDIFTAVMRLTIPSGVGPFVDKLNLILGVKSGSADRTMPGSDTKSQKPLNGSSPPVTEQATSGATPTNS